MKVILEYSEVQECFHKNYRDQEESNGYRKVAILDEDESDKLVSLFREKFGYGYKSWMEVARWFNNNINF